MYSKYAVLKDNHFFSCKHCECYRPRHPSVKLLEKNRMHTICVHCVNVFCFFVFPFHSFLTSLHSGITQVDRTFRPDMLFAIRITPKSQITGYEGLSLKLETFKDYMLPLDTFRSSAVNQLHFVRNLFTCMSENQIQASLCDKFLILSTTFSYIDDSPISLVSLTRRQF